MTKSVKNTVLFAILDNDKKTFCVQGPILPEDADRLLADVGLANEQGRNITFQTSRDWTRIYMTSFIKGRHPGYIDVYGLELMELRKKG